MYVYIHTHIQYLHSENLIHIMKMKKRDKTKLKSERLGDKKD